MIQQMQTLQLQHFVRRFFGIFSVTPQLFVEGYQVFQDSPFGAKTVWLFGYTETAASMSDGALDFKTHLWVSFVGLSLVLREVYCGLHHMHSSNSQNGQEYERNALFAFFAPSCLPWEVWVIMWGFVH
jgi:hypothetical protein